MIIKVYGATYVNGECRHNCRPHQLHHPDHNLKWIKVKMQLGQLMSNQENIILSQKGEKEEEENQQRREPTHTNKHTQCMMLQERSSFLIREQRPCLLWLLRHPSKNYNGVEIEP